MLWLEVAQNYKCMIVLLCVMNVYIYIGIKIIHKTNLKRKMGYMGV